MGKKPGLSKEEKLNRAKSYFLETKGVYQLKELEKSLAKEKSIPYQTIKDVLKELFGCDEIHQDKIGSSTYYWSFPSEKSQSMINKVKEQRKKMIELEASIAEKRKILQEVSEDDTNERFKRKHKIENLERERNTKKKKYDEHKANNPARMGETKIEIRNNLEQLNQWGSNIDAIRSYMRNQYGFEEERFNCNFDIPDDLDVPETIDSYAKRYNL